MGFLSMRCSRSLRARVPLKLDETATHRGDLVSIISCRGTSPHYKWDDSDPVSIRLSLLMLNDMTMINEHLKKQTPSIHTIMVTHTNGLSGYIPDDAAFEQIS